MRPFEEAQAAIVAACRPSAIENVALADAAGRILARDLIALEDLVPFARSAMDGFAVRAADLRDLPLRLPIRGHAFAEPGEHHLTPGAAWAIATGAALPRGADAVIPIEHVAVTNATILVDRPVRSGACVFPPGDDARRGDLLVASATALSPAAIGLLAGAGHARVPVFRRPAVAVICGGDELVPVDRNPGYGQIRNSNGHALSSAVKQAGGIALPPVCLADSPAAVKAAIAAAFEQSDLVVTTGGASVGERDFIKAACDELGVDFLFRAVALRPAKPTAFGRRGRQFVVVLPGNPAAAFAAFALFVQPAIRALSGRRDVLLPRVSARLAGMIRAKPGRHFAAFAGLSSGPDGFLATPLDNQCSSLTRTAADAAAFIIVPPGIRTYEAGERVDVDIFDWMKLTSTTLPAPIENRIYAQL